MCVRGSHRLSSALFQEGRGGGEDGGIVGNRKSYDHRLLYFREEGGGGGVVSNQKSYDHRLLYFRKGGGGDKGYYG